MNPKNPKRNPKSKCEGKSQEKPKKKKTFRFLVAITIVTTTEPGGQLMGPMKPIVSNELSKYICQ